MTAQYSSRPRGACYTPADHVLPRMPSPGNTRGGKPWRRPPPPRMMAVRPAGCDACRRRRPRREEPSPVRMSLEQELNNRLTQAIESKETATADVVRMLKTRLQE